MAVVFNEQTRLWQADPGGTDKLVDDGAPMHASLVNDLPRILNNLGSYVEPCFQFVCSSSTNAGASFNSPQWWALDTVSQSSTGYAFMGTFPLLLPIGAKRLFWTFACETDNLVPLGPETFPTVTMSAVRIYLSAAPPRSWDTQPGLYNIPAFAFLENYSMSDSSFSSGFVSHELTAAPTVTSLSGSVNYNFWKDTTTGWVNWYSPAATFSPSGEGEVMAWCSVAVKYSGAVVNDRIKAKEFSFWGVWE